METQKLIEIREELVRLVMKAGINFKRATYLISHSDSSTVSSVSYYKPHIQSIVDDIEKLYKTDYFDDTKFLYLNDDHMPLLKSIGSRICQYFGGILEGRSGGDGYFEQMEKLFQ